MPIGQHQPIHLAKMLPGKSGPKITSNYQNAVLINISIIEDYFCSDGPSARISLAAKVLRVAGLRGSEVGHRGQTRSDGF